MQIQEILSKLTPVEKQNLYELLKKDIGIIPQLEKVKSELNQD